MGRNPSQGHSRKGLVSLREIPVGVIFTALGALAGTVTVQVLSPDFLRHIILILLAGVFLYTLFSPDMGQLERRPSMAAPAFFGCAGLVLGFYDEIADRIPYEAIRERVQAIVKSKLKSVFGAEAE